METLTLPDSVSGFITKFVLRWPLTIAALAINYLWNAVKAVVAAIAVTASSVVWAPVLYAKQSKQAVGSNSDATESFIVDYDGDVHGLM